MKSIAMALLVWGLVACGGGGGSAVPGNVTNVAPVAHAGLAQSVTVGNVVTLDGSASSDADGDTLTYAWSLIAKPVASTATLSSSTIVKPTFTADLAGVYVASLLVSDGKVSSNPATVNITVSAVGKVSDVKVVFDYTYDSNGFFTPERRALMEKAAAVFTSRMKGTSWARVDATVSGGHYELAFVNPSTLAITWNADVVIPENQITIYLGATNFKSAPLAQMQGSEGDGASQLLSIRNVSGGLGNVLTNVNQHRPVDSSITFDLQGVKGFGATITRQWHFDSDGNLSTDDRSPSDPHFNNYTDFYSTAIHELGHVFGIYDPTVFSFFLQSDPNFIVAYTSRVQSDGAGGFVFTGAHAKQLYFNHVGQNIPLDVPTRSHWANGVRSVTAAGWTSLSYEGNAPFRHGFSELEFGALQDLGYVISPN